MGLNEFISQTHSKTNCVDIHGVDQVLVMYWLVWSWLSHIELMVFALTRNKVIRRMKQRTENGHSFAFLYDNINDLEHSAQLNLPMVSVVMPLKGFGEHNLRNWRSQVSIILYWYNFSCFMHCSIRHQSKHKWYEGGKKYRTWVWKQDSAVHVYSSYINRCNLISYYKKIQALISKQDA